MAASYVLPASAMTHGHHAHAQSHSHPHSHSQSPSRSHAANAPRSLKQQRPNGTLHSYSYSEALHEYNREYASHRESDAAPQAQRPAYSAGPSGLSEEHRPPQLDSYDPPRIDTDIPLPSHEHHHHPHGHSHVSIVSVEPRSRFTNFILPFVLRWPLVHTIMADKDSRRIFYFMSLNFSFMIVQACYGFLTDSLGLLSDSVHMFFDCLALGVGLFAAVASKWPPSQRFPYGFGKIESLSGFGNGVFLMLISIEIMIEATERLAEGHATKRLGELFVVSGLGLAVNLVGMACFGHHGHAGHDHGSHGHSGHSHQHSHDHHRDHDHDHDPNCATDHDHDHDHENSVSPMLSAITPQTPHVKHSHSHSHANENMHGIWLHVLADTMGSAAVMVSTALIHFVGWNGWDPLASCVIAGLIFLSSIPLIKSSAKKLLLTVPDETEYSLRNTLSGVSDLRGVSSYCVPRFWMADNNTDGDKEQVLGVMHIIATRGSDLDDVRERTRAFLRGRGMEVVVQVEKNGDTNCWCGGSSSRNSSPRLS